MVDTEHKHLRARFGLCLRRGFSVSRGHRLRPREGPATDPQHEYQTIRFHHLRYLSVVFGE